MQSTTLRSRPVWKSTRPDDPAGLHPPKQSTAPCENGRLHLELRTSQRSITVQALILHSTANAKEIQDKVDRYASEVRAAGVIELVVIVNSEGTAAPPLIHCLTQVQLLLLDLRSIPVLFADSPGDVESTLRKHLIDTARLPPSTQSISKLLACATASAPANRLSPQEVKTLQSMFSTINELEAATRSAEGQAQIRDLLMPAVARDVIDFWEDEYLAA